MASMRKEVTIGFSAIAVLLLILGGLIYRRATEMWQTPEADAQADTAPVTPIAQVDGRPRIVVAQDTPPVDQRLDGDAGTTASGSDDPYAAPVSRHEPPRTSFLPRQFDPNQTDPNGNPSGEADEASGDRDPASFDGGAMPAETDSSSVQPAGARQTSHEVPEQEFADQGRQLPSTEPLAGNNDFNEMAADPPQGGNGQEWPAAAERDGAEALPIGGAMDGREVTAEQPAGGTAPYGETEHRESFAEGREGNQHFDRSHREPERVAVEHGKYTVAPNDSYWIIAEKVYGNGAYFKALHEHNRARHPRSDKLQVGDVLDAPPAGELAEHYPDLCPRPRKVPNARQTLQPASTRRHGGERVYVVGEGDTLFDIARHELGKASRWTEIYDLNHDVLGDDFDYLRPGTELAPPRDRREADSVTRKDEPVYQR